jgi:hypothetical protein
MKRYLTFARIPGAVPPTVILFGGFRHTLSVSITLTDVMVGVDQEGGTIGSLVGYFRPADSKGLAVSLWPFVFWWHKS